MPATFPQSPPIQAILLENTAHPAKGLLGKTLFAPGFNFVPKEATAAKGSGMGDVGTPRPQGALGKACSILMTLMPSWLPPGTLLRLSPPASSGAWPRLSTLTSPSPVCSSCSFFGVTSSSAPREGALGDQANKNQRTKGSLVCGGWDRAVLRSAECDGASARPVTKAMLDHVE